MKASTGKGRLVLVASWLLGVTFAANAQVPWEVKFPREQGLVDGFGRLLGAEGAVLTDRSGEALVPNCAFGPFGDDFRFFVQQGDPGRLLVFHDGGGACWDPNTCATPLVSNDPTYDPTISETPATLAFAGGVLDEANPANPFKGWTKVFVPYCTGDVGWGNRVTAYPGVPFPIHHRGYANVRTVLRWIEKTYTGNPAPSKVAVAGVSAGAYAAPGTVFPEIRKIFPRPATRTYVIADSGNGVVTDSFLNSAEGNWGFGNTLPPYLVPVVAGEAIGLPVRFYGELTRRFPATRFGQYQNAFDGIQTVVYNTMKFTDDPAKWSDSQFLLPSLAEWTTHMRLATLLAAAAPNYRFYTAAGTEHTVLINIPPDANAGFCSDDFYAESSAGGLPFRDWTNAMVNGGGFLFFTGNWRNATCFPNCLVPAKPGCAVLPSTP